MEKRIPIFSILITLFCVYSSLAAPTENQLLEAETQKWITSASIPDSNEATSFTKALLDSPEWQHELADSGPLTNPAESVKTLFEIWKTDPTLHTRPIDRGMATACALEAPNRSWKIDDVLPRYNFFKTKNDLGLLSTIYAELNVFERRYLAKGVQHQHLNAIESMEYQNREVCLPAERYTGACWYARWILHNPFGDTIHGPMYYQPYKKSWTNAAEMIRNVGGVCGSLSNFGAASAIANGVPASTMGEPGHCAYSVMIKHGKWQKAYSLTWKQSLHTNFFNKTTWGWHTFINKGLHNTESARNAGNLSRLTQHYLDSKQLGKAYQTLATARTKFPDQWSIWNLSVNTLATTNAPTSQWQDLHNDTIKHLATDSAEIASELLTNHIYKHVLPEGKSNTNKRANILLSFQKAMKGWGISRWSFDDALKKQLKLLDAPDDIQDDFMAQSLAISLKDSTLTSVILETELDIVAKDQDRKMAFINSIGNILSKGSSEDSGKVIDILAAKLLPQAAAAGDKSTFQFVGKLTTKNYTPLDVKVDPFPGILLSSGGTLSIDEPKNRYDNPARHWGVIEAYGGDFHTGNKNPHATIQLGNYGLLSGVVIVTRGGNVGRLNGAELQTSIDGKEWNTVHKFSSVKRINRIPLADKDIQAGYVRVIQPNKQPLHFNAFQVFGKKQN